MVHLGSGRPLAALAASPLAVLGAPVWAGWPVLRQRWPVLRQRWPGRWLASGRARTGLVLALLAGAWVWQIVRAGTWG